MARHRVKQRGKKFYPQYRGWGTLWIWGSYNDWYCKFKMHGHKNDNSRRIYYDTLNVAMEHVDEAKKRAVNKNYDM